MKKNIYIGVAWPYVNGDLHVGHLAGYLLPADIFARFQRLIGNNVLMTSGSDCYGTPITVEADKRAVTPQQVVEEYHPKHKELFKLYGFFQDEKTELFTKTTTENHKEVVQDMFVRMAKNGYLLKDSTEQYYSPTEQKFLPDRYVEGECPHCGYKDARGDQCDNCTRVLEAGQLKNPRTKFGKKSVELKKTEHYFIDWPKLQKNFLEKYVEKKSGKWRPWVAAETNGWLKKGLEKRAITRDLSWGVEIPTEALKKEVGQEFMIDSFENKRIYVWFEAVIGYLSASQEWAQTYGNPDKWKDWWHNQESEHYYFMGKDNLIFHTLFWPGQLWGAYGDTVHTPDNLPINHYLNLEGHKFSKSRGIIIDSKYIAETYGVDPVRFYLTWIMPENSDANFSWEHFVKTTNDILIGNIGNFINRTLVLIEKFGFNNTPVVDEVLIKSTITQNILDSYENLSRCEFKIYSYMLQEIATAGNRYLAQEEPWAKSKTDEEQKNILGNAMLVVLALQLVIQPLMPQTSKKIAEMIGLVITTWPKDGLMPFFISLLGNIQKIQNVQPLFIKIDPEIIEKEKAKLNLPQ